ncbi:MAG TPA: TetR/AcrR family transcriptional regulator [Acidimicrobiia bacterium]
MDASRPTLHRSVERAVASEVTRSSEQVERILAAAVGLIRETETLDLRVTDVIAAAGVSNRAFYRHFTGKAELLIAVLEDGNRRYMERLEQRMDRCASPLEAVECWMRGMLARAQEPHPASDTRPFLANGLRFSYEFPEESLVADEVLRAPLRDALVRAHEAGELAHLDVERDVEHVVQLTLGHMTWSLIQRRPLTRSDVDDTVAFALGGLRGRGP